MKTSRQALMWGAGAWLGCFAICVAPSHAGIIMVLNGPPPPNMVAYGTSTYGGSHSVGSIYKMNADGTGLQTLYSFTGVNDGPYPGPLVLSGSTLYGMTVGTGTSDPGILFKINTDGTGFQRLFTFTPINSGTRGVNPRGTFVIIGSTIYGTCSAGGTYGEGAVYRINTDGNGYQNLYSFTGHLDGLNPTGVALFGSTLFGTTPLGNSSVKGALYQVSIEGTGFRIMHQFQGSPNDGNEPFGSPVVDPSGAVLYGTTYLGGAAADGSLYRINSDGSGFQLLHSFGLDQDGSLPESLAVSGAKLFGTTYRSVAGSTTYGDLFAMNVDGTGYQILSNDRQLTNSGVVAVGSTVFVTNGVGTVVFAVPEPSAWVLAALGTGLLPWLSRHQGGKFAGRSPARIRPHGRLESPGADDIDWAFAQGHG
jgi:uncharacterized repeat protein (TIGR03803 family)